MTHRWGLRSWTSRPPRTRRSRSRRAPTRRSRPRGRAAPAMRRHRTRRRKTPPSNARRLKCILRFTSDERRIPFARGSSRRSNPRATTSPTGIEPATTWTSPRSSRPSTRPNSARDYSRWATRSRTKTSDDGETKAAAGWRDCGWSSGCARRTANRLVVGETRTTTGIEPATIRRETRDAGSGPRLTRRSSLGRFPRARLRR
mmetsp:Transcript_7999/g.36294  ORF Transcript_7999/g.36294 Transcript_7999/m.36294 type:complete len:202 (+) Transcript_7999:199-804(+)